MFQLEKRKEGDMNDLIEGKSIGAKPGAFTFIALDRGRYARDNHAAWHHQVLHLGLDQLDQTRTIWTRFASRQTDIRRQIVPEPDHRHSLLSCRLRVHFIRIVRHGRVDSLKDDLGVVCCLVEIGGKLEPKYELLRALRWEVNY